MCDLECVKAVAEHPAFVVGAYILTIGLYLFSRSYGFLQGRPCRLSSIRRTAKLHAILMTIELLYLMSYAVFQLVAEDYKEVGVCFVGVFFSGIYFTRCISILIHVRRFSDWYRHAHACMEAFGRVERRWRMWPKIRPALDSLELNVHVFENTSSSNEWRSNLKVRARSLLSWFRLNYLLGMDPILAFLRWSVITLRQRERDWVAMWAENEGALMIGNQMRSTYFKLPRHWRLRRTGFARDIWLTSLLSVTRRLAEGEDADRDLGTGTYTEGDSDVDTERDGNANQETVSTLSPWLLATHSPQGVFSLKACLHAVRQTGLGIPYDTPYYFGELSEYETDLRRSRFKLPRRTFSTGKSTDLTIPMMEWYLILQYLYRRSAADTPAESFKNTLEGGAGVDMCAAVGETPYFGPHVSVLNRQFGFHFPHEVIHSPLDSGLPMVGLGYGPFLWHSLTVPQTCAHVDNYLALLRGETLAWFRRSQNSQAGTSLLPSISRDDHAELARKIYRFKFFKDMVDEGENQFPDCAKGDHGDLTNSLSFLGAVMEGLRSLLAIWEYRRSDPEAPELLNPWVYEIPFGRELEFIASSQLQEMLARMRELSADHRRLLCKTLNMRLLWECQSAAYAGCRRQLSGCPTVDLPACVQTMILCILGFPTLTIECVESYKFVITPESAPQMLALSLSFVENRDKRLKGYISIISPSNAAENPTSVTSFQWESWRNAFEGRMQGQHEWLNAQELPSTAPFVTADPITAGIQCKRFNSQTFPYWAGWLPSSFRIATFEPWMTPGFRPGSCADLWLGEWGRFYVMPWVKGESPIDPDAMAYGGEAFVADTDRNLTVPLLWLSLGRLEWVHTTDPDAEPCLTDEQLRQEAERDVDAMALLAYKKGSLIPPLYHIALANNPPALHALVLAFSCQTMGDIESNVPNSYDNLPYSGGLYFEHVVHELIQITEAWDASSLTHPSFGLALERMISWMHSIEGTMMEWKSFELIKHIKMLEMKHDLTLWEGWTKKALMNWVFKVDPRKRTKYEQECLMDYAMEDGEGWLKDMVMCTDQDGWPLLEDSSFIRNAEEREMELERRIQVRKNTPRNLKREGHDIWERLRSWVPPRLLRKSRKYDRLRSSSSTKAQKDTRVTRRLYEPVFVDSRGRAVGMQRFIVPRYRT